MHGQYSVTPQKPARHVPTPYDPPFGPKKLSVLFEYAQDFEKLLLPCTEIYREVHAVATGSSSKAPKHKPLFPAPALAPIKPLAPVPAKIPVPSIFSRPITLVIASAQPTSRPTSSHTTAAAQPPHDVTPTQPTKQQSPAAAPSRTVSVSIAAPASDHDNDGSSSDDDAGNNNSHRFASRTATRSFRRSPSMASSGTSVIADSKLQIPKLEKCSAIGK